MREPLNKTYCIYSLEDGYYATDGICTHESVHLEEGLVMDGEIECPMHQGIFDIKTGKAISPPACEDLKTYPLKKPGAFQNKDVFYSLKILTCGAFPPNSFHYLFLYL